MKKGKENGRLYGVSNIYPSPSTYFEAIPFQCIIRRPLRSDLDGL